MFFTFSPLTSRIILPVTNDLSTDQRMQRIAATLAGAGCEVLLVGRQLPDSQPLAKQPYATRRMRLWFRKGKFFYAEYNLRLFLLLLFARVQIVCANDLDTLAACYLASRLRGFRLIYDSHEYFTEVPELTARPLTRSIWLGIERWIFPGLTTVYTVNEAIATIYRQLYNVPVHVIRNLPERIAFVPDNQRDTILLYQGSLNMGRGIELMIE
ncbi:MAG: glycosyltransferase, partial [Bacteroidetes bacterium]